MRVFLGVILIVIARIVLRNLGVDVPQWFIIVAAGGIFFFTRRAQDAAPSGNASQRGQDWESAAHELELDALVRSKAREKSTMRGEINGHRVTVSSYPNQEPEIEVRFESGLRSIEIDRRSERRRERPDDVATGDVAFDELYVVEGNRAEPEVLLGWLNSERREVLVLLADALDVREIEEDELEVKLGRTEWTSNELVQAVNLCVLAASVLDRSHKSDGVPDSPLLPGTGVQDAIIETPVEDEGPQDEIR